MSIKNNAIRFTLFASALLSTPAFAQSRFAAWENGEQIYVGPEDPRARSAFSAASDNKAPLVPITEGWGESAQTVFVEASSVMRDRNRSAFESVPMSFGFRTAPTAPTGGYRDPAVTELLRGSPP